MCTHTEEGKEKEGKGGGANKHGGEFRVYGNYFWAKIHGRGGCVLTPFFFIVAFILCWMWMDGWMRIWDACSIKERESIYVILYIECFFLYFFSSFFFVVIDERCWMV